MTFYEQKFHKGDLVQIADDLGPSMSHFIAGKRAIVMGSYKDQYGGDQNQKKSFTLFIEGEGTHSWYHEHQLHLIDCAQYDLLNKWEKEYIEKYGDEEE